MSLQELYKIYKEHICPYCKNTNSEDCRICKTLEGVKCCGYMKNKSKIKKEKPIIYWQNW